MMKSDINTLVIETIKYFLREEPDSISTPFIQQAMNVDYFTAEDIIRELVRLNIVPDESVYAMIELTEDDFFRMTEFLEELHKN